MKDRFDLLVFDWDGTLFNSIEWIVDCIQRAALACDCAAPSEATARSVIGLSLDGAMAELFPGVVGPTAQRLVEAYREFYFARAIGEADLFAGVRDMLEALREAGYKLAVATGKNRNGLSRALDATATGALFHTVRSAEETASKPNPEMLLQIMAELEVPRERTLMIGDSVHDLRMALNAGTDAVAVACGANTLEQLLALNPLACLENTAELLTLLV
jgi:phosphoglycolate phosphatase